MPGFKHVLLAMGLQSAVSVRSPLEEDIENPKATVLLDQHLNTTEWRADFCGDFGGRSIWLPHRDYSDLDTTLYLTAFGEVAKPGSGSSEVDFLALPARECGMFGQWRGAKRTFRPILLESPSLPSWFADLVGKPGVETAFKDLFLEISQTKKDDGWKDTSKKFKKITKQWNSDHEDKLGGYEAVYYNWPFATRMGDAITFDYDAHLRVRMKPKPENPLPFIERNCRGYDRFCCCKLVESEKKCMEDDNEENRFKYDAVTKKCCKFKFSSKKGCKDGYYGYATFKEQVAMDQCIEGDPNTAPPVPKGDIAMYKKGRCGEEWGGNSWYH